MAEAASLFRRSSGRAVLCQCTCHTECPVRAAEVPEEVWFEQCTCPGSAARREGQRRVKVEMDEHKRRHEEVMLSIDIDRGKSADEIRQMILDQYAARGWAPPTDFGWQSRFIAAAT